MELLQKSILQRLHFFVQSLVFLVKIQPYLAKGC